MSRIDELKQIIEEAKAELEVLTAPLTWEEACKYIYTNREMKMSVRSVNHGGWYHSYEGIGILYAKHMIEGKSDTYRIN